MENRRAGGRTDRAYILLGMRIVGDFGVVLAVPAVAFALAGKWLDGRYGTGHAFTIAGFFVAFAISALVIYRKSKAFAKEYQALQDEERRNRKADDRRT